METLQELFSSVIDGDSYKRLIKIIFSAKRRKSSDCQKVLLRPVTIGGEFLLQAEIFRGKKAFHQNMSRHEAISFCLDMVSHEFKQVNIFTDSEEIQVLASKALNPRIVRKKNNSVKPACTGEHNVSKKYIIPDGTPSDFLIRLGVMDADGKVFPRHYGKFRQINRYLEIVEDIFPYLAGGRTLRIIDFGCGKAYLTFALYYYLKVLRGRDVEIVGLDLKKDVIEFCSHVAKDLGYDKLKFMMGDIADYTDDADHMDMVVTLHACDTATDYALINAVSWDADVILSVPCCQHELFKQIKNDIHQPMLKHGILKDRLTEYLTDGLRGLALEARGYDVAMIEFTSLEHTARNIMIKAVKSRAAGTYNAMKKSRAENQFDQLCAFYNVEPTIKKLLRSTF